MKQTQEQKLINLLKWQWMSSFQMQQELKSSSADRAMRRIRENPPQNYMVVSRQKKVDGYNTCLEYKLVPENSQMRLF